MKRLKHGILWCLLLLSAAAAEAAQKPNFIVILADDLGYGDLACYGAEDVATPQIDQMAREGAKFTACYVAPVCSPTRASLMTGCIAQRVEIDGKDIWPLLAGKPDASSPHEAIYYLRGRGVDGIRVGDWKYLVDEASKREAPKLEVELTAEEQKLPRKERNALTKERSKAASQKLEPSPALYHLGEDLGEQYNLIAKHPEIVGRLKEQMEVSHKKLRENTRPAGVANQP